MVRKIIYAASILVGTTVGVGIFGIPYVISKSGFPLGLLHLISIALIIAITMLYLGEIILRTKENKHLTGYAEKYLGEKGKLIMFLAFTFGVFSTILAYIIGAGESLSFLFFESTQYTLHFGIAFWIILSAFCYIGLKALKQGEFLGVSIILFLIISVAVFFSNKIDLSNLTQSTPSTFLDTLVPFGVIMFAFMGYATIPEINRIIGKQKSLMKPSILLAVLVTTIIYIAFTAIVIGFKGQDISPIATISLGKPFILLGILTIFTSYLAYSIAFIDILRFDYKKSKPKAWLITISIPLILFLILEFLNKSNFTHVLGIGGAISGGLTAILIFFMIKNAKISGNRSPEYSLPTSKILTLALIIIFTIGTVVEIINIL